jgi:protein O-GlcNAc transferase
MALGMKLGRNDPCGCGSGKKYKNCCLGKAEFHSPEPSTVETNQLALLFNAGRYVELESRVRKLLGEYPNSGFAWKLLGASLQMQGKDALHVLRKATELLPNDADAFSNLGVALKDRGQLDGALASFRRALEIKPDFAEAHSNLGVVLTELGQLKEAVASCRRALEIKPDNARAHNNLANALKDLGQLDDAVISYRRALKINPDFAEAHSNLGTALQALGRFGDAAASYRRAFEIKPDYAYAFSNLLMMMQYAEGYTQAESYAEHLSYAQRFEEPLKKGWLSHPNSREPGKRLKIGYVSPDFRNHAVAYFIEPVLTHHDREQVEVYCYYTYPASDEVTMRLKSLVDHWRDIRTMSDVEAAMRIREDGIDILIDLAGHTAWNRLQIFARKPAPVQATWLGYSCTTGLSSIDYRISDIYADPVGMSEQYYSETLYRLPDTFVCYSPARDAPAVGNLPALAQGGITFGSFNNLNKVTPKVRALWAQVLLAVPGSRLMLKTNVLSDKGIRQKLIDEFAEHGVGEERLVLASRDASYSEHMNRYNTVDIGLDPFPYNGGTTSVDAMWMGVPVVSLAGNSFGSRMGVSMLSNLGLPELIAQTPEDYVAITARLAGDLDRLAKLRAELRGCMANSPLTDAKRFTINLENAYRKMWQTFTSKHDAAIHC